MASMSPSPFSEAVQVLRTFLDAGLRGDHVAMRGCLTKKTLASGKIDESGPQGVRYVLGEPTSEGEAVIVPVAGSSSSIARMRSSESATHPSTGVPPPASPLSPPCGTTGTRCAWHSRKIAATSSVDRGLASARGRTPGSAGTIQSPKYRGSISSPVRRPDPRRARSSATRLSPIATPFQPLSALQGGEGGARAAGG